MIRRTSRQLILALAAGGAAACVFPTDACGCTPVQPPSAMLEGTVVDGAGASIPNARVFVYATRDSVPPSRGYLYGLGSLTNARGEFRAEVGGGPGSVPVWVHATIIRSNGADTARVRGGTVLLGADRESRPTVRMTFQLP